MDRSPSPVRALRPARRPPPVRRCAIRAILLALALVFPAGCGGGSGDGPSLPGTVFVRNETDLGMAPLVVEQFFLQRADGTGPPPVNLLQQFLQPGGVVTLGLFPPGLYNATAVLEGGGNVNFMDEEIRSGEPKNFVIP